MKSEELYIHNLHWESVARFASDDPHLRRAAQQPFAYQSPLVNRPEFLTPGIFMLTGGRQVGKSTCLKQFIAKLLTENRITPDRVTFIAGELFRDDTALRIDLMDLLKQDRDWQVLILDEINYIKDWDKAIKYLADAGYFENVTVLLSGSDSAILREAMKRFAGRRGRSQCVDFIYYPLDFAETVMLKAPELKDVVTACRENTSAIKLPEYDQATERLESLFDDYLHHGGYLTAIADWMRLTHIEPATYRTYAEWLRGDILKHNKQEIYLFELLRGMMRTYASQISWVSLSKMLSIEHHKTVSDYVAILVDMHAVIVQAALTEHTLSAAPKKAKKLYFEDPFIFHAVAKMLKIEMQDSAPALAETVAVSHFFRKYDQVYYIKGDKGEVDIAYVQDGTFYPVEVKWTNQIRPESLKQISRYKNGLILGKKNQASNIAGIPATPLIRYLLGMSG